jgi:hypothetical protein
MSGRSAEDYTLPDAAWQLLSAGEQRATDRRKQDGDEQHVANTDAAKEARKAAELLDVDAAEARRRVPVMSGDSRLDRAERTDRAERAERELGKGRTTVLEAIQRQRARAGAPAAGDGAPRGPGAPRPRPRGV